jgi:conjugative relaxase-like TrwC/TraI family protein
MLSISSARTAEGATSYYTSLEADAKGAPGEYYAKEGAGYWMGKGAQTLGLVGEVTREDFKHLAQGYDPTHGDALAQNAGDPDRRAGWDLTFSAPKSVSVAWSIADPETRQVIEAAHAKAVAQAFDFMQGKAGFVRTGKEGYTLEQAGLAAAAFQHGTSREQDAQLHTHVFVMNSGIREDGRAASLASEKLFEYKMAAGAAYQVSLAHEMREAGFKQERDGENSFRLQAIPHSLEYETSTRRNQIEEALKEKGASGGKAAAVASLETRKAKEVIERDVLATKWTEQAARHGITAADVRPDNQPTTTEKSYECQPNREINLSERSFEQAPTLGSASLDSLSSVPEFNVAADRHAAGPDSEKLLPSHAYADVDAGRENGVDRLRRPDDEPRSAPTVADALKLATEHDAILRDSQICLAAFRCSVTATDLDQARRLAEQTKAEAVRVERLDGKHDPRGQRFTTPELMRAERDVINIAQRRGDETGFVLEKGVAEAAAQRTAEAKGYSLNDEQRAVLDTVTGERGGVHVVIGDAGAGKSTTMYAVREAYEAEGFKVIGASSGTKASLELMESAKIESTSLAKLHYDLQAGRQELDNKTVIVVDEAGMVDSRTMAWVQRTAEAEGAKVVLVGDDKQIQPVGPGATFRHLAELPEAKTSHLEENQRQKQEHEREAVGLVKEGHAVTALGIYAAHGQLHVAPTFKEAAAAVAEHQVANIEKYGAEKTVAIAATRVEVAGINEAVRDKLKEGGALTDPQEVKTAHGKIELAEGDRVLFTKPDKGGEYANSDIGTIKSTDGNIITVQIDRTKETIDIDASKADFQHGYCMTAHRTQGATLEAVTAYTNSNVSRELGYVMLTRDKQEVSIVMSSHNLKELKNNAPVTLEIRETVDKVIEARAEAGKTAGISEESRESYGKSLAYLEKNQAYAPELIRERSEAQQIKEIGNSMSISKPKDSTLDYQVSEPEKAVPAGDRIEGHQWSEQKRDDAERSQAEPGREMQRVSIEEAQQMGQESAQPVGPTQEVIEASESFMPEDITAEVGQMIACAELLEVRWLDEPTQETPEVKMDQTEQIESQIEASRNERETVEDRADELEWADRELPHEAGQAVLDQEGTYVWEAEHTALQEIAAEVAALTAEAPELAKDGPQADQAHEKETPGRSDEVIAGEIEKMTAETPGHDQQHNIAEQAGQEQGKDEQTKEGPTTGQDAPQRDLQESAGPTPERDPQEAGKAPEVATAEPTNQGPATDKPEPVKDAPEHTAADAKADLRAELAALRESIFKTYDGPTAEKYGPEAGRDGHELAAEHHSPERGDEHEMER